MAIVVEDGTGVAGANSYISLADANAHLAERAISVTLTDAQLLVAMDVLEAMNYDGYKVDPAQALQWPRYATYNRDGHINDSISIPAELPKALISIAVQIAGGLDTSAPVTPAIKREKVDVLEIEYAVSNGQTDGGFSLAKSVPAAFNCIRHLLVSFGRSSVNGCVARA